MRTLLAGGVVVVMQPIQPADKVADVEIKLESTVF
jgi:hypothetical protein